MDAYLKNQFDFTGVKAALLVEQSILVILRDDKPDIPWPNMWELPGGGREGQETLLEWGLFPLDPKALQSSSPKRHQAGTPIEGRTPSACH